jgi:hypothetical protein
MILALLQIPHFRWALRRKRAGVPFSRVSRNMQKYADHPVLTVVLVCLEVATGVALVIEGIVRGD